MSELSTARPVSRRSVVRGASWAVPVVTAAAIAPHAAATASCDPLLLNWSNSGNNTFVRDSATSAVASVSGLTVTVAAVGFGMDASAGPLNLTVAPSSTLRLQSNVERVASGAWDAALAQTVRFTFTEAITSFTLAISDIDGANITVPLGEQVRVVSGLLADSWAGADVAGSNDGPSGFYATQYNIAETAASGQATFLFASPVTTFDIEYIGSAAAGTVNIHPLVFTRASCL